MEVKRYITKFLNDPELDGGHVEDIVLSKFDLGHMQKLFGTHSEDPMYGCFPINKEHENYFKNHYGIKFELDKFIYYLEACSLN